MEDRKPLLWFGAVIALALAAYFYHSAVNVSPAGDSPSISKPKLAVIVGGPDAFWQEVAKGAKSAADDLGAVLDVRVPDGTGPDQTATLVQASTDNFDGLAISPLDPEAQTKLISGLAARIKVVTYDNDAPQSLRYSYIGSNNTQAGRLAADLLQKAVPDGGKVAIFIGDNERQNARDRRHSFINSLMGVWSPREDDLAQLDADLGEPREAGDYTIVATYLDGSDPKQAAANAAKALEQHSDLAAMVAMYGYNGPACLQALDDAGKLGEVAVIAFDEHEETLAGIAAGNVVGAVVQDPFLMGYKSVEELCKLCRNKVSALPLPGAGSVALECRVVDQENLEKFQKDLAERRAAAETAAAEPE